VSQHSNMYSRPENDPGLRASIDNNGPGRKFNGRARTAERFPIVFHGAGPACSKRAAPEYLRNGLKKSARSQLRTHVTPENNKIKIRYLILEEYTMQQ
jgi:hypothetical protein